MLSVFRFHKKLILAGALLVSFFVSASYASADIMGDVRTFSVNSKYDEFSRTALSATLRHLSNKVYFYVDDRYWVGLNQFEKNILLNNLDNLGREFDDNIYSKETDFFGFEPNPGIDDDARVVVLVEDLIKGNGGYFETANLYSRELAPGSNEREMVAVNTESLGSFGKIFLAHEFQHLISFNQKDLLRNTSEDIWLNELRSEYANTVAGYNDSFQNSNLNRRLDTFLTEPSDSLVEWPNVILDYSHEINYLQWLFGGIKDVSCFYDTLSLDVETEDIAIMLLRFSTKAMGDVHFNAFQKDNNRSLEVIGEKGTITCALIEGRVGLYTSDNRRWRFFHYPYERDDNYIRQARNFIKAIKGEEKIRTPLEEGVQTLKVCLAAKKSADGRKVIEIR